MGMYILRRLLQLVPVMIGVTIIVFSIIRAIPGDPARTILGLDATPEAIHELREEMGLNSPAISQYFSYLKGLLTGDLGTSLRTGSSISKEIFPYFTATMELMIFSIIIAIVIGVNLGILAAWKSRKSIDFFAMLVALIGISIPVFWFGLMEQWVFAEKLQLLPSMGRFTAREPIEAITGFLLLDTVIQGNMTGFWDVFRHLILPAIALGSIPTAVIARMSRSSMLDVMDSDYIRTARAKGLSEFWVLYKHALKNALGPVLTVIGLMVGLLLGGGVLTETIFSWPGIGRYIYDAISARDYPVIQSGILIVSVFFVLINLIVDILVARVNPRIRF